MSDSRGNRNRRAFSVVATVCPNRETLLQYSLGMLPGEQQDILDRHLDECPDCQATILTLDDSGDTVIGGLRMPLSGESVLAEPQLQDALAAALAMPQEMRSADKSPLLPGPLTSGMPETLGEYQLLEELGRGGMGRVYKALHTKLDRVVAVKVLPSGRVGDRKAIVRFEREMKAVGRLVHPNIVQAYDAREIDGTPVLIMEFVDGLDLAEMVRRARDRLRVADACELVRQTALALQCAHEHGLVHRDVKPSNIMLARSGEVKLLDLGLAGFYAEGGTGVSGGRGRLAGVHNDEEMTGTGQAMGTADYMAPEQASDSRTVDIRADIYSLGCTLYKLLTGRAPFSGPRTARTLEKLKAHVHQPAPPIRQLVPDVPEKLAASWIGCWPRIPTTALPRRPRWPRLSPPGAWAPNCRCCCDGQRRRFRPLPLCQRIRLKAVIPPRGLRLQGDGSGSSGSASCYYCSAASASPWASC